MKHTNKLIFIFNLTFFLYYSFRRKERKIGAISANSGSNSKRLSTRHTCWTCGLSWAIDHSESNVYALSFSQLSPVLLRLTCPIACEGTPSEDTRANIRCLRWGTQLENILQMEFIQLSFYPLPLVQLAMQLFMSRSVFVFLLFGWISVKWKI